MRTAAVLIGAILATPVPTPPSAAPSASAPGPPAWPVPSESSTGPPGAAASQPSAASRTGLRTGPPTVQQTLHILVPTARNYGGVAPGSTVGGTLGEVTVEDTRGGPSVKTWIVTVSATAFVSGGGGAGRTVPNGNASYWSGRATRSTGGGIVVPGQPTSAQAQSLNVPRTAFSKISGIGNDKVSWNPTLSILVPTGTLAGAYRGTITHSVA